MSKITFISELKNYLYIIFGALLLGISVALFFTPNNFTTGGTPGLAILLHHLTSYSIGEIIMVISAPVLLFGMKYVGKHFAFKTLIALILISLFIEAIIRFFGHILLTDNIFLAAIFGGYFAGIGIGLIIKANASAGGTAIIAKIIKGKYQVKTAKTMLMLDIMIVTFSIYVFNDIEKALWSMVSVYVTAKAIDMVLTGTITTKVIHITTFKPAELSAAIADKLEEKGIVMEGTGLRSDDAKTVLFMVLDVKKIPRLHDIIQETDEDAFMLVMEASELIFKGHKRI